MAYMRGCCYIWGDDSRVHLWFRNGYDAWDESGWNEPEDARADDGPGASGVAVPIDLLDEFVAMRTAQLLDENRLAGVVERAVEKWSGNGGCEALVRLGSRLRALEENNGDSEGNSRPT